jgi:ribosomal protein S18 acetylase RimI-like enzyme
MFEIRKPCDNELYDCAELAHISGKELLEFIFAGMHMEIMMLFFTKPRTFFSRENILVYAEDEKVKGMILGYSVPEEKAMTKKMFGVIKDMLKITRLKGFIKIMGRMSLNRHFPKKDDDEYFISNLAVFADYRRKGIGMSLLRASEEIAVKKGMKKLSLYVESDNTNAKRLYEKYGFIETAETTLPESYQKHGIHGFFKMVKCINEISKAQ